MPPRKIKATFIEPMLLLPAGTLPDGPEWSFQLKLDGYRAIGMKAGGTARLRSRKVTRALAALLDETAVDGEVVGLDQSGRPSFNALRNSRPGATVVYYVFDAMVLSGRDITGERLSVRRELLTRNVLPLLGEPVHQCPPGPASKLDVWRKCATGWNLPRRVRAIDF